jgi:hypothetical protein
MRRWQEGVENSTAVPGNECKQAERWCVFRLSIRPQQQCGILISRLCSFFMSLLWVVLAGRVSKTTCGGVTEGLFSSGGLFATLSACVFHGQCIRKRMRRANYAGTSNRGRQTGRGEMGLMCDGGLGVCAVWVIFGERYE